MHTASFSLYTISLTSLKFFGSVIPDESGSGGGIGFQDGDAAAGPGEGLTAVVGELTLGCAGATGATGSPRGLGVRVRGVEAPLRRDDTSPLRLPADACELASQPQVRGIGAWGRYRWRGLARLRFPRPRPPCCQAE